MCRKTRNYMKYSANITFSPLHFMLYRGKSITYGTVHLDNRSMEVSME